MLRLKKIAVTGGIASGKSAVCQVLQELGAFVVDADAIVHELLTPDTSIGQQVIRLLGNNIVKNGKLSRRAIADKVFNDPETLHALEKILHPAVLEKINLLYRLACSQKSSKVFFVEIPLLFEIGQEKFYDAVIVTITNEKLAQQRYRSVGHSDEEFFLRMKRQLDPEKKAQRADYVIRNEGSIDDLRKQVKNISNEVFSS